MSLTRHLRSTKSPIRNFFWERFPDVKQLLRDTREQLGETCLILPPEGADRGTLGNAFEFRARIFLSQNDLNAIVPDHLATFAGEEEPELEADFIRRIIPSFNTELPLLLQAKNDPQSEDRLVRYCFCLGWLEQKYRAAFAWPPIFSLYPNDFEELLALPAPEWVADVRQMFDVFRDREKALLQRPVTLDPTLEGSEEIGGADADLIADHTVVDLKTVEKILGGRFRRWLYQVIGYALLDYHDTHRIAAVSIYFARYGRKVTWPFPDILNALSPHRVPPLVELRQQFREIVRQTAAQRQTRLRAMS